MIRLTIEVAAATAVAIHNNKKGENTNFETRPFLECLNGTYVECSAQPTHSEFLLAHFSGTLILASVFNIDFPSMIRLNNIIAITVFVVYDNYHVCGECLIYLKRSVALGGRNAVPLDWQKSQFHLYCQTWTGAMVQQGASNRRERADPALPQPPVNNIDTD